MESRQGAIYAVAGGNHVTILLDGATTDNALDAIDVLARPGGGPPPHRHAFAEWFRVFDGDLTLALLQGDKVAPSRILSAGDSVWIRPWTVHGTLNLSSRPVRFQVVVQPSAMAGFLADAGVPVSSDTAEPDRPPAGLHELRAIGRKWGIELWDGPTDQSPIVQPR